MKITNNHNLPEPVYKALSKDSYSMGDAEISVTTMIDSPRINKRGVCREYEMLLRKIMSVLERPLQHVRVASRNSKQMLIALPLVPVYELIGPER